MDYHAGVLLLPPVVMIAGAALACGVRPAQSCAAPSCTLPPGVIFTVVAFELHPDGHGKDGAVATVAYTFSCCSSAPASAPRCCAGLPATCSKSYFPSAWPRCCSSCSAWLPSCSSRWPVLTRFPGTRSMANAQPRLGITRKAQAQIKRASTLRANGYLYPWGWPGLLTKPPFQSLTLLDVYPQFCSLFFSHAGLFRFAFQLQESL